MNNIAKYLDHTNLNPSASRNEIKQMISEAKEYGFNSLCVDPSWVNFVKKGLEGTDIKTITVPNWKHGGGFSQCVGILDSLCENCDEIDYIWNIYEFSDLKDWEKVAKELKQIREKTKGKLKVIIESYYIRRMDEQLHKVGLKKTLKEACKLVNKSGADYIKTDSGLFKRPDFESLVEEVEILLKHSKIPVKASGGISTAFQVQKLVDMGVKLIGTSKGVNIATSDI